MGQLPIRDTEPNHVCPQCFRTRTLARIYFGNCISRFGEALRQGRSEPSCPDDRDRGSLHRWSIADLFQLAAQAFAWATSRCTSSYPVTSIFGVLQIRETDFTNEIFYAHFKGSTPPWLSLRAGFLHQPFTTFNWLSTEKTPGTPFARMPAMFLSISLSTTPIRITWPFSTIMRIGFMTPKEYFCRVG